MTREATQSEKHDWWMTYGVDLRGFNPGGGDDGIVHWMADVYIITSGQPTRASPFRACDMLWDDEWSTLPGEEVSCMACIAQSCGPAMTGETL